MWPIAASWLIALPLFITHGFYRVIFRYSGMVAMQMVLRAFALYGLLYASVVTAIGLPGVPRSVGIIQPLLLLLAVGTSRALALLVGRPVPEHFPAHEPAKGSDLWHRPGRPAIGTGQAHSHEMQVVAFLDDDDRLHGHVLNGLPIHSPMDLRGLVETQGVRTVLLGIPSLSLRRRNEILSQIRSAHVAVRTLPSVTDLAQGKVSVSDLHELAVR